MRALAPTTTLCLLLATPVARADSIQPPSQPPPASVSASPAAPATTRAPDPPPPLPPPPPFLAATAPTTEASDLRLAYAGIATGVALMLVPVGAGGSIEATSSDVNIKRGGVYLLAGGLALAPIVSHLFAREWARAGVFGALPLAAFASIVTLLEVDPTIFNDGSVATRVSYGFMLCVSAIFSTVGVADSLSAPRRIRERHRRLTAVPAPIVVRGGGGLALGGAF